MTQNIKQHSTTALALLLSLGSSLVLGLLSFGGFYAVIASVPLSLISGLLASLYETEIYFENIKDLFQKILEPNHFDNLLAESVINDVLQQEYKTLLETKYKQTIRNELSGLVSKEILAKRIQSLSDDEFSELSDAIEKHQGKKTTLLKNQLNHIPLFNDFECSTNKKLPLFFTDYLHAKRKVSKLKNLQDPNQEQTLLLERAEKNLMLMQHYCYQALQHNLKNNAKFNHAYAKELANYLSDKKNKIDAKTLLDNANRKKLLVNYGLYACAIFSTLFSLGSVYLILETLTTLSIVAVPFSLILGLSVVCGVSIAALTANSLSDMIWNETLSEWHNDIQKAIKDTNNPWKATMLSIGSIVLIGLAACLTVFTWGTWRTITDGIKKIPNALKNIPTFITKTLLPSINAAATLVFTLENTKNSLDLMLKVLNNLPKTGQNFFNQKKASYQNFIDLIKSKKIPTYKIFNPFNFLIYVIETPLKVIGFIAHIVSVSVTTNRIPHVPMWISMLFAFLSELFEDLHYFFFSDNQNNEHECNHDHSNDIPSRVIHWLLSPLYFLSYVWDTKGSVSFVSQAKNNQWFSKPQNFYNFWQPHENNPEKNNTEHACAGAGCHASNKTIPDESIFWQQQKILLQLDDKINKTEQSDPLYQKKCVELKRIHKKVSNAIPNTNESPKEVKINKETKKKIITSLFKSLDVSNDKFSVLNQHRHLQLPPKSNTASTELLEELSNGLLPSLAAGA